jgi:hypothetical protein
VWCAGCVPSGRDVGRHAGEGVVFGEVDAEVGRAEVGFFGAVTGLCADVAEVSALG